MAFNKGPSIVSNGLYYYIDPANKNYYSGSTTTINNMIGAPGPNLNLVNSPSYNTTNAGVLVFDGASSYIDIPQDSVTLTQGSSDFSIGGWIYPTRVGPNALWAVYFAGQQYYPATFLNVFPGSSGRLPLLRVYGYLLHIEPLVCCLHAQSLRGNTCIIDPACLPAPDSTVNQLFQMILPNLSISKAQVPIQACTRSEYISSDPPPDRLHSTIQIPVL